MRLESYAKWIKEGERNPEASSLSLRNRKGRFDKVKSKARKNKQNKNINIFHVYTHQVEITLRRSTRNMDTLLCLCLLVLLIAPYTLSVSKSYHKYHISLTFYWILYKKFFSKVGWVMKGQSRNFLSSCWKTCLTAAKINTWSGDGSNRLMFTWMGECLCAKLLLIVSSNWWPYGL